MGFGAYSFRDQGIGCFLDAVVNKPIGTLQTRDEFEADSLPQIRVDLLLRSPTNDGKRLDLGAVSKAGKQLQCFLGAGRQPLELADHEVDDIVREAPGLDAVEIPGPDRLVRVEFKEVLFAERRQKLDCEKRVAQRFLVCQACERLGGRASTAECVRHELG
jgi:hypothetical protein